MSRFRIGDRVAYNAEWLCATQRSLTLSPGAYGWLVGEAAFARGTIVDTEEAPLLAVQWDSETAPRLVLSDNLCREDRIHFDALAADAARTRRALERYQAQRANKQAPSEDWLNSPARKVGGGGVVVARPKGGADV